MAQLLALTGKGSMHTCNESHVLRVNHLLTSLTHGKNRLSLPRIWIWNSCTSMLTMVHSCSLYRSGYKMVYNHHVCVHTYWWRVAWDSSAAPQLVMPMWVRMLCISSASRTASWLIARRGGWWWGLQSTVGVWHVLRARHGVQRLPLVVFSRRVMCPQSTVDAPPTDVDHTSDGNVLAGTSGNWTCDNAYIWLSVRVMWTCGNVCVCADVWGEATDKLLANTGRELSKQQDQERKTSEQYSHCNTASSTTHSKDEVESVDLHTHTHTHSHSTYVYTQLVWHTSPSPLNHRAHSPMYICNILPLASIQFTL